MKTHPILLASSIALIAAGCSNIDRSRDVADANVSGKVLAEQVCSNCHGFGGNSISPAFPRLAGQPTAYLTAQLKGFRSHERSDPAAVQYMWGLCRFLTDKQIEELAEYYAQQTPTPNGPVDPTRVAAGQDIFANGIKGDKEVPACQTCHGAAAEGKEAFPRLANQHSDYVLKQLAVFQSKKGRPNTPMDQVAPNLSDEQKAALAAYVQILGRSKPPAAN